MRIIEPTVTCSVEEDGHVVESEVEFTDLSDNFSQRFENTIGKLREESVTHLHAHSSTLDGTPCLQPNNAKQ